MNRQTKYVVIFQTNNETFIGPEDNGVFHNIEDMKASFSSAKSVYVTADKLIIMDFNDQKTIGQIHKVKSYL
jgi:hypothetical protein